MKGEQQAHDMLKDCHGNSAGPGQLAGAESGRDIGLASHQGMVGLGSRGYVGWGGVGASQPPTRRGYILSEDSTVTQPGLGVGWGALTRIL